MSKKGIESTPVKVILIVLMVAFVTYAIGKIISIYSEKDPIERCRQSVILVDSTRFLKGAINSPFTIDCPRTDKKVKVRDVVVEGKIDKEMIKSYMAEEIRKCWYKFGEGKLAGFNKNFFTDASNCVVCGKISFEKKIAEKMNEQLPNPTQGIAVFEIDGFSSFLKKNNIPNTDITYSEYLGNTLSPIGYYFTDHFETRDYFNISNAQDSEYYIVYTYAEPAKMKPVYCWLFYSGAEAASCYINEIINNNPISLVYVMPLESLSDYIEKTECTLWQ